MFKLCPKYVLAIGIGLLIGVGLAVCSKDCHSWKILGIGLGVGLFMAIGERLPNVEARDDEHHTAGL